MSEAITHRDGTRGTGITVAERVFAALQDAIVRGELAPGTKLSEADLARHYGVSRGPLREAIGRLEGRRLVERVPHVGARVTALSRARLIDIYRVREALEGMACRLAAVHMTAAEIDDLQALLDEHADRNDVRANRGYYQSEGDLDFHYRIARGSRNETLCQLLCDELYHLMRLYRYRFSGFEGRTHTALDEHRRIVAALRERDADFAELLMRRHIAGARRTIEEAAAAEDTHSEAAATAAGSRREA